MADRESTSSASKSAKESDVCQFIVVGQKLANNKALQNALKSFAAPVICSDTGFEHLKQADEKTVFVVETFEGTIFRELCKWGCRIVAPPVVLMSAKSETFPYRARPLYCLSMDKLILCFSGIKAKQDLTHMVNLVHHMGGGIRKDFSAKVTHLVAVRSSGEKYRTAVSLGTHIMSEDWVHRCWELRDNIEITATHKDMMLLRLSPFSFCILSFHGFSKEEEQHMEDVAVNNGGAVAQYGSPTCTHLVVNDCKVKDLTLDYIGKLRVVKPEWFWASIQMEACADVSMYAVDFLRGSPRTDDIALTPNTLSGSKSSRKKRAKENIAYLAHGGEQEVVASKRKSLDSTFRSADNSFLDVSGGNSTVLADVTFRESHNNVPAPQQPVAVVTNHQTKESAKLTARQQTIFELFQTESNYVGILHTILNVFKEEIERVDQPGGPILDPLESKAVFGGIPPIYDVHSRIRNQLNDIVTNWTDNLLVGSVFLNHVDDLKKFYPNFVNYFEKTKEFIANYDKMKPRFHAFLRLCQGRPECGRQTLTELLIRPVQRLPSVLLLLKDILKRTDKADPDHEQLSQAICALEKVMTNINEDKRKADGHQAMFEVVNNIENCPPSLLSSFRSFICKVDTVEVSEELLGKGDPVTLFVFSDSLEICKRRTKALNTKSPGALTAKSSSSQKSYRHLDLWPLRSIRRVVNICESNECHNVFALISKKLDDKEERLFSFAMSDSSISKDEFLTSLSKAICSNVCRADYEKLMAQVEAQDLNIDASDLHSGKTLSRAANKFSKRVSRAFSLNKSPKENMMRTMRSMTQVVLSPLRKADSLMTLPPLPLQRSLRSGSMSSCAGSEVDVFDTESYSERVDQMSIGTPTLYRRHDASTQSVDASPGMQTTPRSGRQRPNVGLGTPPVFCRSAARPEFASTQSLTIHCKYESGHSGATLPKTLSLQSCADQLHKPA